ncbi:MULTISPECIES: hypothetical protein [Pseudomonadaceae]|uniref:hypothetical protein n=1 Tax=Pseudomonas aeruginosa TaxID=287 RepID=UPI003D277661
MIRHPHPERSVAKPLPLASTSQADRHYLLSFLAEDHVEHEVEITAADDAAAIVQACRHVAGGEGLLTGISLTDHEGTEIEPQYGWL